MVRKILFGLLALPFFVSACQPSVDMTPTTDVQPTSTPKSVSTATPTYESPITVAAEDLNGIEIEVWHSWFGAPAALFDLQVNEFNEENPWGITVTAAYQGSYHMLFSTVDAELIDGTPPDLVVALSEQIAAWNENDTVNALTPYILDPEWGLDEAERNDIPAVFLAQDQHEGEWLAFPAQRTARFILYNVTWAKELGFDAAPTSFDEFREQACTANLSMRQDDISDNDGKGGWIVDYHNAAALSWLYSFGGTPLGEETDYEFASDENMAAFRNLKALYDDNCAWLSTAETPYEQFALRSALFITASMEEFNDVTRSFVEAESADEWQVIPFPGDVDSTVVVYGSSYAVLTTEDAEALASWLFIKWMLAPPQQVKWVKSTGLFPLRISALDELSDYESSNPHWGEAVNLIEQGRIQPQLGSWRQARHLLGDGLEYIYRYNTQTGSISAILALMDQTATDLQE